MPGPVEQRLIKLGITSAEVLSEAATLDKASRELIDHAAQETAAKSWNAAVTTEARATGLGKLIAQILARSEKGIMATPGAATTQVRIQQGELESPHAEL